MSQLSISVNGRTYTIACDDGQEEHLARLADYLDSRVSELTGSLGQLGEANLLLMAGLLIADELADAYAELAAAGKQAGAARRDGTPAASAGEVQAAEMLESLAARIEAVAARLEGS
ncbi:MAG: cell division protein ZapA [Alphaproteobacteria bacterium]